jgi:large subunit ribosomal protein L10
MPSEQILQEKIGEVEAISELLKRYKVIGVAGLQKVRAAQLQELKKNLIGNVFMRVIKNTLVRLAIENSKGKPGVEKLLDYLSGSNVFLMTDLNPFKLALLLERGKVKTTAKAGDTAAFDVVVSAGNTGQAPGPIISQLNAVGLPTRIEGGSVWVNKDTLVVKRGEEISERLASVLSKLGIKPVEAGLVMKVAYDDGMVISQEQLRIDVDATRRSVEDAQANAFALSLGVAYPTPENVVSLLQIAHQKSYALSMNAAIPTKKTISDLVRKAYAEMVSLSSRLPTLEEKTVQPDKVEKS